MLCDGCCRHIMKELGRLDPQVKTINCMYDTCDYAGQQICQREEFEDYIQSIKIRRGKGTNDITD